MLADFGADVVKVEPPGGDPARSDPGFVVWNRGKRSIVARPRRPGRAPPARGPAGRRRRGRGERPSRTAGRRSARPRGRRWPPTRTSSTCTLGPFTDTAPWAGAGESAELVAARDRRRRPAVLLRGPPGRLGHRPHRLLPGASGARRAAWPPWSSAGAPGFGQRVLVGGLHGMVETLLRRPGVRPAGAAGPPTGRATRARPLLPALRVRRRRVAVPRRAHRAVPHERRRRPRRASTSSPTTASAASAANLVLPENHGWVTDRIGAAFKSPHPRRVAPGPGGRRLPLRAGARPRRLARPRADPWPSACGWRSTTPSGATW